MFYVKCKYLIILFLFTLMNGEETQNYNHNFVKYYIYIDIKYN